MKRKRSTSSASHDPKRCGEQSGTKKVAGEVKLGDLIWIKNHGLSWWPAQVVDANNVSEYNKPKNRSVGEVLVRLYGSYTYIYVDPAQYRSEFETLLKQHNGRHGEILQKSLELELSPSKPARSKGTGSKSKGKVATSIDEKSEHDLPDEETKASKYESDELEKQAASVRRTRAQKAGLVDSTPKTNFSKNKGKLRGSTKNNLVDEGTSSQARSSARRKQAATTPVSIVENDNLYSGVSENTKDKNYKQGKLEKQMEAKSPEIKGKSHDTESKAESEEPMLKKPKLGIPITKEVENIDPRKNWTWELKANNKNEDKEQQEWVQKEVMSIVSSIMEQEKVENFDQDGQREELMPNSPKGVGETENRTPKEDGTQLILTVSSQSKAMNIARTDHNENEGTQVLKANSPSKAMNISRTDHNENEGMQLLKANSTSKAMDIPRVDCNENEAMQTLVITPPGSPLSGNDQNGQL